LYLNIEHKIENKKSSMLLVFMAVRLSLSPSWKHVSQC